MDAGVDLLRVCLALIFVIGLLALSSFLIRKYGHLLGLPTAPNMGRNRRLQLIEILNIDPRTKLALVRRDGQEHLLLIGQSSSEVVERNLPAQLTEKL
jgi:flagellar protein FliO/FliZ